MTRSLAPPATRERGIVLIATLLLLIVMTIFAMGMFRSVGVQELIAGNVREKQRALQTAVSAEQYAEYWLTINNNSASGDYTCSGVTNAVTGVVQICSNILSKVVAGGVTTVPWTIGGLPTGFTYNPGNSITVNVAGGANTYYGVPQFYISDLGSYAAVKGEVYEINAFGYGGTGNTVAVIDSTYVIKPIVGDLGGL
jgi:type IV pilus assembly protein PilX